MKKNICHLNNEFLPERCACHRACRRWLSSCHYWCRFQGRWDRLHPHRCTWPNWCSVCDLCYRAPPSFPRKFYSDDVDGHALPIRVSSLLPPARLYAPAASSGYSSSYLNSVSTTFFLLFVTKNLDCHTRASEQDLTDCQSSGSSRTSCLIFFTSCTFWSCSCAVRYSEHGPTLTNCKGLVACLGGVFKVVFNFGGSCVSCYRNKLLPVYPSFLQKVVYTLNV